jgi:hypothetical protein
MRYVAACLAAGFGLTLATTAGLAQKAQQVRMKSCNAAAGSKHLTAGSRKAFMSPASPATPRLVLLLNAQQQMMKDCSATAAEQNSQVLPARLSLAPA